MLVMLFTVPARAGPEQRWCSGNDHVACPDGYLCDLRTFNCAGIGIEQSNIVGVCVKRPEAGKACPLGDWKVCGCHGNTYADDCARLLAGEAKSADGDCGN